MISELPLPKSEIPYEVQVYEKILDDGSFENLNFSEYKNYEGNYTISLASDTDGFQNILVNVLVSGSELDSKKNYSVCNSEFSQINLIYKNYEKDSDGYSENCFWINDEFGWISLYYAECDDICLDYTYNFDYSRFKSTDPKFLEDYSYKFFENVGGLFGGGTLQSMDFEGEYINF